MICHPGYTDCKDPLCCPAWWGFLNAAEKDRIESVINKAQRYGYLSSSFENVHSLVDNMESKLFNCILSNPRHLLYQLLPPEKDRPTGYNLRQRSESHHLISTYCIVYTLFAGLFTKLVFIFVLIFMLLSLSAFVRFLLKKLLA